MSVTTHNNFINGEFKPSATGNFMDVTNPVDNSVCGRVTVSDTNDVAEAVAAAKAAFPAWSSLTVKARAAIMFRLHHLINEHADELADIVVLENGKNKAEALASVAKGNETVEWACSLPQLVCGRTLQVSRGITCHEVREPLGVCVSIVPFNFPAMVPMWTIPIMLTTGNCVILKPSEKVPGVMGRIAELMKEAGVPDGVFQCIQGTAEAVTSLCDHEDVSAVTFVGSSNVADLVATRCRNLNKRVLALGGAKNHLVALEDCDVDMASQDIVASFAGCCGQRCMAASALIVVGDNQALLDAIIAKAGALTAGQAAGQVGPVVEAALHDRIMRYINEAEAGGATILLDGRPWVDQHPAGNWVGPTIILHNSASEPAMQDEIFGPVLSVLKVNTWDEALAVENANPYGNAAAIYTSNGGNAEHFTGRFRAAMIGVNIGIPVPREPFSFGGLYGTRSKYGDMDITGNGMMEFSTNLRKITTKWSRSAAAAPGSGASAAATQDRANFDGQQ